MEEYNKEEFFNRDKYPLLSESVLDSVDMIFDGESVDQDFMISLKAIRQHQETDYVNEKGEPLDMTLYGVHRGLHARMYLMLMQLTTKESQMRLYQRMSETEILFRLGHGEYTFIASNNSRMHMMARDIEEGKLLPTDNEIMSPQAMMEKIKELSYELDAAKGYIGYLETHQMPETDEDQRIINQMKKCFATEKHARAFYHEVKAIKGRNGKDQEVTELACEYIKNGNLKIKDELCNKPLHDVLNKEGLYKRKLRNWNSQIKDAIRDREEAQKWRTYRG